MRLARIGEGFVVGVAGGALAGLAGSVIGLGVPTAVVGAVHGALAGYRQIYPWRRLDGVAAFVLDHSWALTTSAASLVSHAVAAVQRQSRYVAELSERQGRHVYIGGFRMRRHFVVTVGNTISGAVATDTPARQRLITDHEHVHVWQSRWFGPMFPALYFAWMIGGGAAGFVYGVLSRRERPRRLSETWGYYANPFEWWAYSREGRWPPDRPLVWRRPLTSTRVTALDAPPIRVVPRAKCDVSHSLPGAGFRQSVRRKVSKAVLNASGSSCCIQ